MKGERGGRPEVLATGLCRCPGRTPPSGTLLAQLCETAVTQASLHRLGLSPSAYLLHKDWQHTGLSLPHNLRAETAEYSRCGQLKRW